jgi:hypothetical protein
MDHPEPEDKPVATVEEIMQRIGIDITICQCYKKGRMQPFGKIPKGLARPPNPYTAVAA